MSESRPFITVLMATYNEKENYLKEAVESILNQTYGNFEFLICDDSTNQETKDILDEFTKVDKRVRIIRAPERLGFVKSLNEGLRQAKGEWIARMDSDDIAFPNRFEEEIKFIGQGVGAIGSECITVNGQGKIQGKFIKTPYRWYQTKLYLWLGKTPIVHPTALINKELLLSQGGYDVNFKVVEDFDIWIRLVQESKLINVPKPLLYYRVHETNVHLLKADLIRKVLCVGMIKYALGIKRPLSKKEYEKLENHVESSAFFKSVKIENYNKNSIKILLKIGIYPELPMLFFSIYYRIFRMMYRKQIIDK